MEDFGHASDQRPQRTGISQGCTLSPLLFVILMTMLMHDAVELLSPAAKESYNKGDLANIVYADDTLLLGVSAPFVSEFINAVETAGKQYGLELHYGKLQLLQVNCHSPVHQPDGECLAQKNEMGYLGTVLNDHGYISSELNRRIGGAKADFTSLSKVWSHASVTRTRKLLLHSSLVESKLLYSLACTCPTKADLRRLDGFQVKCIRKICPSRRSVASIVLGRWYLAPATSRYIRKVGRPRKEWITTVSDEACRRFGSMQRVAAMAEDAQAWKQRVHDS